MEKKYDWLLSIAYNPTYDKVSDFQYIYNMSLDNTLFLSYDDYLKLDWVKNKDAFKDDNGNFSEAKLLNEYNKAASLWGKFSSETLADSYTYSMWDTTAPPGAKLRNPGFYMTRVLNPDDYSIGVFGFNEVTPSRKSWRELALGNKIFDTKELKFTDKSVNDISLFESPLEYFKSLLSDPLIYATYDLDTEEYDPYVGLVVKHYKGEKKVDKFGNYYTETLNGRSLIGKEIVAATDYITAEGTKMNNYDFFDSDDKKKSIGGIITQNLASIAPFFIPYVNTVYTGMVIAKEMASTLPMLYGIITGLTGGEDVESPLLNTIAAYGERFRTSTSDYAKENTLSFENIANLASMVVGQWNQCRMIGGGIATLSGKGLKLIATANALAFNKYNKEASRLLKDAYAGKLGYSQYAAYIGTDSASGFQRLLTSGKWAETPLGKAALLEYLVPAQQVLQQYNKIGLTLSIAYMSIICNTIVYDTVVLHGATPFEAACITLGSIAGMFSVDKFLGLGEIFFDPDETAMALKTGTKNAAKALMDKTNIKTNNNKITEKGIVGLMQKGAYAGRKVATDFVQHAKEHSLGFVGKTVGVALENVAEQVAADVSLQFGEIAGRLGYFSLKDYGAWDNVVDRYLLNAIGGAFGGSMFYVLMAFHNRSNATNKLQKDLLYLLSTGRVTVELINNQIDAAAKLGLLGSRELSNETTLDENGNTVYLSAYNGRESQADYWARFLKNAVSALNQTIVGNKLNYTEDLLFDKMVLGEYKRLTLADLFAINAEDFKATSYITKFYDDYFKAVNAIANKEGEINELMSTTEDTRKSNKEYEKKLQDLEDEKQKLIDDKDYLFGEGSLGYVEKTLFAMDTRLNWGLIPLTKNQMARLLFYKPLNELTPAEQTTLELQYDLYKDNISDDIDKAYDLFKNMGRTINPDIQQMSEQRLKEQIEATEKLVNTYSPEYVNYDTKLEGESDEEYEQRNTKKEGESDKDFNKRKKEREQKILELLDKNFAKWIDDVLKLPLTHNIKRLLEAKITVRKKDIVNFHLNNIDFKELENEAVDKIREQLKGIDFTNELEVNNEIDKIIKQYYIPIIKLLIKNDRQILINEGIGRTTDPFSGDLNKIDGVRDYILKDKDGNIVLNKNIDAVTYEDFYNAVVRHIMERKGYEKSEDIKKEDILEEERYLYNAFCDYTFEVDGDEQIPIDPDMQVMQLAIVTFRGNYPILKEEWKHKRFITTSDEYNNFIYKTAENLFEKDAKIPLLKEIKSIAENPNYTALLKVEQKQYTENPIIPLLKTIASIRNGSANIDSILTEIYTIFNNVSTITDFRITDSLLQALDAALGDMRIAKAYLHAASVSESLQAPIGHNKAINDFVKNHPEVFKNVEQLPEISGDLGNYLINEIQILESEAKRWKEINDNNKENRLRRFSDGMEKLNIALVKFFKTNREAFKLSDDVDLLEGFESYSSQINQEDLLATTIISLLLHDNFAKAVKKGISEEQIFKSLFDTVENGGKGIIDLQEVITQYQAKYDHNLSIGNITNYDKFLFIIHSFAMSDSAFLSLVQKFMEANETICPLPLQERAAKIAVSHTEGKDIINKALNYVLEATLNKDKIPVLKSALILTGIGGAGKSYIISRLAVAGSDKIWISGPGEAQISNLNNSIKVGEKKSLNDLLVMAIGKEAVSELQNSIDIKDNEPTINKVGKKYFTRTTYNNDELCTVVLNPDIKINKIVDAPKYIIIDEASWIPTYEVLVLDAFCAENNIELILIADLNLNGKRYISLCDNIDTESIFSWRTPELYLSLRDNTSIQKDSNLNGILSMIYSLRRTRSIEELNTTATREITGVLNKFKFKYFLKGDLFFGEYITDSLDENILNTLKGTVCYIGNKGSATELILLKAGILYELHTVESVQGSEYDYVIVDKDWNYNLDSQRKGEELNDLLHDVYTMISRSRNGTIIMDNNFSLFFKSTEDTTTGTNNDIKEAILNYRSQHMTEISVILEEMKRLFPEAVKETPTKKPTSTEKTPTKKTSQEKTKSSIDDTKEDNPINLPKEYLPQDKVPTSTEDATFNDIAEAIIALAETDVPVRGYGNVHIGGITITGHDTPWINDTSSKRDLGIFVEPGKTISSLKEKQEITEELLKLKSFFHFKLGMSAYELAMSAKIREKFSFEAIQNAQYYIRIETPNNTNTLVGHTTLDNDKRAILNNKMATVIAKIKGKDGNTYELSLGGLANPETWISNLGDIHESLKRTLINLRKRVTDIESQEKEGKGTAESQKAKERLNNLISRVEKYNNNVDSQAQNYATLLQELIKLAASNSEESYDYAIEAPEFSGLTELVDTPGEMVYRLEHLSDSDKTLTYEDLNEYAVVSPTYIVRLSPYDLPKELLGRAVMFVSSNPYLHPDYLVDIYMDLKNNPEIVPSVRMVTLSNLGVSFKSLYKRYDNEKYRTVYKDKDGKEYNRYVPFENQINGIRMYNTFWNFRAAITRFVDEVKAFKENSILSNEALNKAREAYQNTLDELTKNNEMSDDTLLEILKRDSELYDRYNKERKKGDPYLNEDAYRSRVRADNNVTETLKAELAYVWAFNDYLSDKGVREFRLGYSKKYGFYNRRLTHLGTDAYKGVDNPIGVYINPDLAVDYKNVIDALFTNIIDKIIPPAHSTVTHYITNYKEYNPSKDNLSWFRNAEKKAKLDIPICDSEGNILKDLNITVEGDDYHAFSALPGVLISTARHLYYARELGYMESVVENPSKGKIKYKQEKMHRAESLTGEKLTIELDWLQILNALSNPLEGLDTDNTLTIDLSSDLRSNVVLNKALEARNLSLKDEILPPGVLLNEVNSQYNLYDMRLENLFDLIFHGHIVPAENADNLSKDRGILIATDAYFKYGIFVDPVKVVNGRVNNTNSSGGAFFEQLLSGSLYGADKVAGFPLMVVSLKPKKETVASLKPKTKTVATKTTSRWSNIDALTLKKNTRLFNFIMCIKGGSTINLDFINDALEFYGIKNVEELVELLNSMVFPSNIEYRINSNDKNIIKAIVSIGVSSSDEPIFTDISDIIKQKTGLKEFTVFKQLIDNNGRLILTLNKDDGPRIEIFKTTDTEICIEPIREDVKEVLKSVDTVGNLIIALNDEIKTAIDNLDISNTEKVLISNSLLRFVPKAKAINDMLRLKIEIAINNASLDDSFFGRLYSSLLTNLFEQDENGLTQIDFIVLERAGIDPNESENNEVDTDTIPEIKNEVIAYINDIIKTTVEEMNNVGESVSDDEINRVITVLQNAVNRFDQPIINNTIVDLLNYTNLNDPVDKNKLPSIIALLLDSMERIGINISMKNQMNEIIMSIDKYKNNGKCS